MELYLTEQSKKDLIFWKKSGQSKINQKIEKLFKDIQKDPFKGIQTGTIKTRIIRILES